jgi:hypothetical protein
MAAGEPSKRGGEGGVVLACLLTPAAEQWRRLRRPEAASRSQPAAPGTGQIISTRSVARYIEHGRLPSPQHNLALTLPRAPSMLWRAKPSLQVEA